MNAPHHDPNYDYLGAESIRERIEAVIAEIDGVRHRAHEDIEYIHRMRVASRRLRAALDLFESTLKMPDFKKWSKPIRGITRELGMARDADVQIEFVEGFLKETPDDTYSQGLERLILRLKQHREAQQPHVVKALDKLEKSKVLGELEKTVLQIRVHAQMKGARIDAHSVRKRARDLIAERVAHVLVYEPYVEQEEKGAELHQMRIETKRLRYALEIFNPAFGGELKDFIKQAKQVQELLGQLQDSEVWIAYLAKFEEEERAKTIEYFGHARPLARVIPGLHHFSQAQQARRKQVYLEFVACWKQLKERQAWHELLGRLVELSKGELPEPEAPAPSAAEQGSTA